jgi:hypothetical protein
LGPKHVVLIAKANVNEEINSYIIDGKLYANRFSTKLVKLWVLQIFEAVP